MDDTKSPSQMPSSPAQSMEGARSFKNESSSSMPEPDRVLSASNGTNSMDGDSHLDCDDLEERFAKKLEDFSQVEQKIFDDFASWQRVGAPVCMGKSIIY